MWSDEANFSQYLFINPIEDIDTNDGTVNMHICMHNMFTHIHMYCKYLTGGSRSMANSKCKIKF